MFKYYDTTAFEDIAGFGSDEDSSQYQSSVFDTTGSMLSSLNELQLVRQLSGPTIMELSSAPSIHFGNFDDFQEDSLTPGYESSLRSNELVHQDSIVLPFLSRHNSGDVFMGLNSPNASAHFTFTPFEENKPLNCASPISFKQCMAESEVVCVEEIDDSSSTLATHDVTFPEPESSDGDWIDLTNTCDSTHNKPSMWTVKECKRLRKAVSRYGSSGNWKEVAKFVGTRSAGQCINKWKNDLCKDKKTRWNAAATKQLLEYMKMGLSEKEISERMPEYTYIQIYQQIRKNQANHQPWEDWEIQLLIKLKREGKLQDTEIGRKLNNRHRDSVKNKWCQLKRQYGY